MPAVYLHDIQTAVPATVYAQTFVRDRLKEVFAGDRRTQAVVHRIYGASGIDTRHSVVDDFDGAKQGRLLFLENGTVRSPSTAERNARYTAAVPELLVEVGGRLLDGPAGFGRDEVTHVITVSCTGFFAPGPDYVAVRALGLPPTTKRFHLGFMGCFAAFQALQMARAFCLAEPDAVVLVVCVELCSLHLQFKNDPDTLISGALFADGAAGALVSGRTPCPGRPLYSLGQFSTALSPEGEKDMAWTIGDHGFDLVLSQYVPRILESNVGAALAPTLAARDLRVQDVDRWAVHPGGRSILDKVEAGLGLGSESLAPSRRVLLRYGNMSSATILFVLREMLDGLPPPTAPETVLAMAFGPGLTIESALLERLPG